MTITPISALGSETTKLSREALYRRVWSEPMTKLAPQFGLSDVGLAKVCQKHQIPRPPVGYWARLGVGQHVDQPPLPELDEESLQEIEFFRRGFFDDTSETLKREPDRIVVEVSEQLRSPHELVAKTKNLISASKSDDAQATVNETPHLNVNVSKGSLPRALKILDAVIKQWEELGGEVKIDMQQSEENRTRFGMGPDSVAVTLFEEMKRVERTSDIHRYYQAWDYKRTGRLVLTVSGRWADGKQQKLENVLGSFIKGLQKWIAHERDCRLDDECEQRQKVKAAAIHGKREQLEKQIKQRRESLEQCAENFAKSELIRRYIATFESKLAEKLIRPRDPEGFPEWLEWAKWYADMLDPLTPTPVREEYSILATNTPISELDFTRRMAKIVASLGVEDSDALHLVDYKTFHKAISGPTYGAWSETSVVLEGLGYDVSGRPRF